MSVSNQSTSRKCLRAIKDRRRVFYSVVYVFLPYLSYAFQQFLRSADLTSVQAYILSYFLSHSYKRIIISEYYLSLCTIRGELKDSKCQLTRCDFLRSIAFLYLFALDLNDTLEYADTLSISYFMRSVMMLSLSLPKCFLLGLELRCSSKDLSISVVYLFNTFKELFSIQSAMFTPPSRIFSTLFFCRNLRHFLTAI